ncbi:alcohol dehydrogenase catalytic domain-containing protein [Tsukamurella pseudospumae]|uniref:Alcohol dehydrogenase-like N-terminal domain-containing protein n=1 Tax=Tsukamurella pseudospumae TaxID=239498 RepID=A0A137ZR21_9ACTN|nr:alcohol dehydrogenase catalytic domain-containing protein [Tsukamurella pseudospumae]KXP00653.1 hypothetical protein AXK61_14595 [Tsukamurella pseudospumae]
MESPQATDRPIRARTAIGHYARMLTPDATELTRLGLERGREQRQERVIQSIRGLRRRKTMRALVARPGGNLAWESAPAPQPPDPAAAVVRPVAVATCDLDRAMMLGRTPFPLPMQMGHECVAEVVEAGGDVSSVAPGDLVVVPFQISCGKCTPCASGRPASCLTVPPGSMYGFGFGGGLYGGALADLMTVPFADAMLVPLPPGVEPAIAASAADNLCDAYRQVAPYVPGIIAEDADADVLIVARLSRRDPFTAKTPLYAAMIARALGARRIGIVDARPAVQDLAQTLGFNALDPKDPRSWPEAPLAIDATGSPSGLRKVMRRTAPDGTCVCTYSLHRRVSLPLSASYARNITLRVGRTHVRTLLPDVLALISSGSIDPSAVTTATGTFDEAPAALRAHCSPSAVKTVLTVS